MIHKSLENAINQSIQRKNRDDVNEKLIRKMYETMQIPCIGVDCDLIIVPLIKKENNKFFIDSIMRFISNQDFFNYIIKVDNKFKNREEEER